MNSFWQREKRWKEWIAPVFKGLLGSKSWGSEWGRDRGVREKRKGAGLEGWVNEWSGLHDEDEEVESLEAFFLWDGGEVTENETH